MLFFHFMVFFFFQVLYFHVSYFFMITLAIFIFTFSYFWLLLLLFSHSAVFDTFVTPWTVAHQVYLSMGFPRQEYWSGLPFPSPGNLPNSGIKPTSLELGGRCFTTKPQGSSLLDYKLFQTSSFISLKYVVDQFLKLGFM